MPPQTKRQKEVLEIIARFIKNRGFKPSYQQIARELGVRSKSGIAKHIKTLEQLGCINRKHENGVFVLELCTENENSDYVCQIEWLDVPRSHNYAESWEFEPLLVPRLMLGFQEPERLSAFRVNDDAMLDSNICEGDIVLIEKRSYARDGDIVVALVNKSEAVLRKYYRLGARTELRAANNLFETLVLPSDKIEVKGAFQSLLRPAS